MFSTIKQRDEGAFAEKHSIGRIKIVLAGVVLNPVGRNLMVRVKKLLEETKQLTFWSIDAL